jgi:hypothetical protein
MLQSLGGVNVKVRSAWSVGGASIATLATYSPSRAQLVMAAPAGEERKSSARALKTYDNHRFMFPPWRG